MKADQRISKTLSYWLRHAPEAASLRLDGAGWAAVTGLVAAFQRQGMNVTLSDIERVVADSEKQRFEISPSRDHIRARQGHSVDVEAGWAAADPPPWLYHGTVERFLPSILAEGLVSGARHHVHLSPDIATARQIGSRRGKPVILAVRAGALAAAGAPFFLSSNGVWLTDSVPKEFLERRDDGD
jgi:putative RNA 2'-phosphotransferase